MKKEEHSKFMEGLSLNKLSRREPPPTRQEFIASHLKKSKATRFYNKAAKRINDCIEDKNIVQDGKVILLDDLKEESITNEKMREALLKKLENVYLKMKSVSDFMITIGAAINLMAFDTRVVGILNMQFGLNVCVHRIQSSMDLYKALENELAMKVCEKLNIELSHLDRILFQHSNEIEALFREE